MTKRFGWLPAAVCVLCATPVFAQEAKTREAPLVIGTELDYPPYSFLDENGKATGYNVELTEAIAGVMNLDVEIRIGPWAEIRRALETGAIDAVSGMFYSVARDKVVDFSPPYTIIHHAIFVRRDAAAIETEEDLRGRDIIVMRGDIMHDYVVENGLSDNPVLVDTQAGALRLLASGKHDCALLAKLPGLYCTKDLGLSNIAAVGPLLRPSDYGYAVTEGNAALQHLLGEGLAALGETGRHREIYDKWLGVLEPRDVSPATVIMYVALAVVPLLLFLAISVIWSRTLKRQVVRHVADLRTSKEWLRLALSAADMGTWRWVPATNQDTRDGSFNRILGLEPVESVQPVEDFLGRLHPDDRASVEKAIRSASDEHKPYVTKFRILRPDGEARWLRDQGRGFYDDKGEMIYMTGAVLDITEREQADDELRKHRDHLEELVEERTAELRRAINLMAGREVRMLELRKLIQKLRAQLASAGLTPVADDPLKETGSGTPRAGSGSAAAKHERQEADRE